MFEHYTENARRVIFFARYEASQFGSPYIETEHLLLGLLREDTGLVRRLSSFLVSPESIRKQIEELKPPREKVSTSVDVPLSAGCKRILGYGAEEAERLAHKHIGTEHLLLGLLREEDSVAAKLLSEAGLKLSDIREGIRLARDSSGQPVEPHAGRVEDYVEIHGRLWGIHYVRELSEESRRFHWEKRQWTPRDALVQRSDKTISLYTGQPYDPEKADLVKGRWAVDRCVICRWALCESSSLERGVGYTNGQSWLCTELREVCQPTTTE
jgi:hypothetical protein